MQRNSANNRGNEVPKEVCVEHLGRFGNYFFASGYSTGFGERSPRIQYSFKDIVGPVSAEFSFPITSATAAEKDATVGRRDFIDLFWINDGYQLKIDKESPVTLSYETKESHEQQILREVRDHDFQFFLEALESINTAAVWTNRVVMEIVNLHGAADQALFFRKTVGAAGWQVMETALMQLHPELRDEEKALTFLDICCHRFAGMDSQHIPLQLKKNFAAWLGQIDVPTLDRELLHRIIFQLARFDLNLAYRITYSAITTLELEPAELAALLKHCYPRHSQWWILHTLKNEGLGPEQVADALNVAGTAAATQGQTDLAALSYEAALRIAPKAQSAAWNLGCLHADRGEIDLAGKAFSRISRHFANESLSTRWPQINGVSWPAAAMGTGRFTLPPGSSWPRITVVTPSLNQGGFIEETILSVLNQNYPNLQYIVVDGASTDATADVLNRYSDQIDHLIVEADNGQSEAINKGLRLADGELVAWLNSDDMYAPGALHVAALRWIESQADVIAGICLEHEDHFFRLINRPAAKNIDFNPPQLARIFKYWFKGYYFYQPEAFFSKKILDRVGLLDESLYYAMDYDLWMRFAKAEAILEVADWPFAFFRKHDTQKTANFMDCVEEQAEVRGRHHQLVPGEERLHQVRRGLSALKRNDSVTVAILSKHLNATVIQSELDAFPIAGFNCFLTDREDDPRIAEADVVILLVPHQNELEMIGTLRAAAPGSLICGWFWNSGQDAFENHSIAESVDLVFHGHAGYGQYLRNDRAVYGGYLPACVTGYARQDVGGWFAGCDTAARNSELQGVFIEDVSDPGRTEILHRLLEKLPGNKLSILTETGHKAFLGRPAKDRFAESCRYQTCLILPFRNDLPQQVFEALLAGQIPLIPEQFKDLDLLISKELQQSLPIIRFSSSDPAGFETAWRQTCGIFKSEGPAGIRRRHDFALASGMFSSRINELLGRLASIEVFT